ncbi:methyl-accepting chemotaxis protein [Cellvibrio sp. BR]|uniref:methyl-accepting chemotaxis protein n=1 Tax=unclassified Cellvibrio TaxID=2624793 RepID=UPI0002600E8A|nr:MULTISPECIES: methyl-accepting chemotaxis protein [unclassified Cellvibrio]EIK42876.1 methyl-accepting chemotaxis protein [Cellvibrio sp. BR]UUA74735.1 methyl-accepting chemotaxis protein [Cellvibrio sp. QJXJ]
MNNLSLKMKILLSVTLSCVAAVVATAIVTAQSGIETARDTIIKDTQTLAQVLGEASVGAITFDDAATVAASLNALKLSPRVQSAAIYSGGKPFAWYVQGVSEADAKSRISTQAPSVGMTEAKGQLTITEAIQSDGQTLAYISMVIDMAEVQTIVAQAFNRSLVVVIVLSLLALAVSYAVQKSIVGPINNIVEALRNISEGEGDLTRRLPVSGRDEVAELASCFNRFVERLQGIIGNVIQTAASVRKDAQVLSATARENELAIQHQQNEIQQIVTAIREMAAVVDNVSQSVSETANQSQQADSAAASGKQTVALTMGQIQSLSNDIKTAAGVIDQLQQETQSIGSVLDVIRGIAEQTNLLALNAAIEAARAGEQGRGFAVVADEVRTLASRTQTSTTEIREMIERLQSGSHKAVEMMSAGNAQAGASVEQAGQASVSLENITSIVSVIRDRTNQIAAASEQQSAATRQIEKNVQRISNVAVESAQSSSRICTNTEHLAAAADQLSELVSRFRV